MIIDEITDEMIYLCIGEDFRHIKNSKVIIKYFKGVKYYTVDNFNLIANKLQIFCSCNESYCWHIFKIILFKQNKYV